MTTPNFCRGHEGQRIGKSITHKNGKPVCSQCGRRFPPGTWLVTGETP